MSILGKIGKIALAAAPYVAAPFTGGASLYAAPAANATLQKWNAHDATENAKKGLGPSSFDRIVGLSSNIAGLASDAGMLGKFGAGDYDMRKASQSKTGKLLGGLSGMMTIGRGIGPSTNPSVIMDDPRNGGIIGNQRYELGGRPGNYSGVMRGLGPVMGRRDQNVPNLAESIGAGRQDAIRNQPFRQGYDVISYGPEPADDSEGNIGPEIRTRMPPIYPTGSSNRPRRTRTYGTGTVQ